MALNRPFRPLPHTYLLLIGGIACAPVQCLMVPRGAYVHIMALMLRVLCVPVLLQEREAARARAEADKKKAKLTADIDRLRARLQNLADQAAAKQDVVKQELQKKRMEKELELQVRLH